MDIKTKDIYSEVYQILNMLGNDYIDKLPTSLYNMLKEKRNIDYNPKYIIDTPLNEQNIKKESISVVALLHLNYWCEDEEEKLELKKILKDNEDKHQQELREKYNPDDIFEKNRKEKSIEFVRETEVALVEYKETVIKRIINKIKKIFYNLNKGN